MAVQYHCHVSPHVSRDTALPLVEILVMGSKRIHYNIIYIYQKNKKVIYSNYIRRIPKLFRLLWIIVTFRFLAYLLNMICLKL